MDRSGIFLAIVFIGCLSAVSMAIEDLPTLTAGIDFGTSTSCVGVYMNGHVEIIPNDQGNCTTPSWVAFTDSERPLIGEAAKNQAAANPQRTIFDVRSLIGRKFEDKEVQNHMKRVPYKVVNQDGKPYIQVESKVFSPEEISAIILAKQKETTEAFLGKKITKAVVPVPAYFDDAQRQATKDACFMAGYNDVRIINEPTSVGFAYSLHKEVEEKEILVFDLGDGTFDVSVLTYDSGIFAIYATTHTHLGGKDLIFFSYHFQVC
ncbi:heat shock 70 kDa protein BIP1-like [Bidens hawaiensis]|uniref:heat shock 70 kDa protein BIP1-like n=1 Tax=Bidens hawaiensis TaxID=980011 RepID=UPI00404963F1